MFGIFNYIFFAPGFKKNTLAFLKVPDNHKFASEFDSNFFPLRTLKL